MVIIILYMEMIETIRFSLRRGVEKMLIIRHAGRNDSGEYSYTSLKMKCATIYINHTREHARFYGNYNIFFDSGKSRANRKIFLEGEEE